MRLTILQDYLRMGGTERQTLHLAEHAAGCGHRVTLVLFRPGGALAARVKNVPYRVITLQHWDSRVCLFAPRLPEVLDELRSDIVLCMGRTANCYAGWIQERRPGLSVVGTIRTGKVLFPWHLWSLGMVRAVLVNTRWWQRRLREWGLPAERIYVVHNSLLSGGFAPATYEDRVRLRREARATEDEVVLLQVAGFRPGKRHAELIRQLSELPMGANDPPWRLWLVGDGAERARCERLVASLGLTERVHFWGFQSNPHQFYSAADVAVSLSIEDSLPNFIIEAQSNGLPVVAADYRGVREACIPGLTGEITPQRDPASFRRELGHLIANPQLRHRMGEYGRAFALERFSPIDRLTKFSNFLSRCDNAAFTLASLETG